MNKKLLALLIVLVVFGSNGLKAQTKTTLTKTKYSYSFKALQDNTPINDIVKEIKDLKGVTVCKSVLKPEQHKGQLIVIVEEHSRTSEDQEMFQPTDLKKIIQHYGLTPNELVTEPVKK
mgnify:CR=1 FL=1|tara:strand:+ start:2522 stop:2878 length:357 start_codon:yes stop_codon:yes gene_type:complete